MALLPKAMNNIKTNSRSRKEIYKILYNRLNLILKMEIYKEK